MTLALTTGNDTPIFDELLDAHFRTIPTDTHDRLEVIDADIVLVQDTPIAASTDETGHLPDGAEAALWILALGTTIGVVIWLCTLLGTSGIA